MFNIAVYKMHYTRHITILFSLIFISSGSKAKYVPRSIVGGHNASIRAWPFLVSIQLEIKKVDNKVVRIHICGGSVLDEYHVLTASHCFDDNKDHYKWYVLAGKTKNEYPGIQNDLIRVKKIHRHPDREEGQFMNDLAILKLMKPLPLNNKTILPIGLETNYIPEPCSSCNCRTAGWGRINKFPNYKDELECEYEKCEKPVYPTTLQAISDVPIVEYSKCKKSYNNLRSYNFCAGKKNKDSCVADSGGPMVCNGGKIAGIVSYGSTVCGNDDIYPGVYLAVAEFRDWIKSTLKH